MPSIPSSRAPTRRALRPHFDNVRGQGDRISSAANPTLLNEADSREPFFDRHFGHTWSFTPKLGAAVYGETTRFHPTPIDHMASGQFLRVPFRRVPVIEVASMSDLRDLAARISSNDPDFLIRWRGQNKEHYLARDPEEATRLYGEPVRELSLLPSAARAGIEFGEVFSSWAAILDMYLMDYKAKLSHETPAKVQRMADLASFRASYRYRLWAFATAQHYGLPSVGLDVTPDLPTAVMFALHRFQSGKNGLTTVTRIENSASPVLYAMGGFSSDLFDDAHLAPEWLQCSRPRAQHAHFLATAWGASANKAAEHVFVAIRLRNHGTWTLPRDVKDLFPTTKDDPFLAFLLDARRRFPALADVARLNKVYFV